MLSVTTGLLTDQQPLHNSQHPLWNGLKQQREDRVCQFFNHGLEGHLCLLPE